MRKRWLRAEEPTDQVQAVRTITALYRFLERPLPEIVFFDNVTAAVLASRTCAGLNLGQEVDRALRTRLAAQMCKRRQERLGDYPRVEVRRKLRYALQRLEAVALNALKQELSNHLKAPDSTNALGFLLQENWLADAALIDYCVSVGLPG